MTASQTYLHLIKVIFAESASWEEEIRPLLVPSDIRFNTISSSHSVVFVSCCLCDSTCGDVGMS